MQPLYGTLCAGKLQSILIRGKKSRRRCAWSAGQAPCRVAVRVANSLNSLSPPCRRCPEWAESACGWPWLGLEAGRVWKLCVTTRSTHGEGMEVVVCGSYHCCGAGTALTSGSSEPRAGDGVCIARCTTCRGCKVLQQTERSARAQLGAEKSHCPEHMQELNSRLAQVCLACGCNLNAP